MVRGWIFDILGRLSDLFQEEAENEFIEVLGSRNDDGSWECCFCMKNRVQKKYPDLYRHIWSNHYGVVEEESGENERSVSASSQNRVRKRDLLDEYSLEDSEERDEGLDLQEPSGSSNSSKLNHLMTYYERITQGIEENGQFRITSRTHIGSARGGHIKQNFKMAVRRIEDDSLENYKISNDGGGDYPIIIERRN